ncbi:MAG: hypothetical protein R2854_12980 [Caldilineaceae bacterium]
MPDVIPLQGAQSDDRPCQLHPQSMCPAFGALRVLTRIEGCHPVMATDAGCLYGLTFVTHFYGRASPSWRRRWAPPNSCPARLWKAHAAIDAAAQEPGCRLVPVVSLCVAETAGLPDGDAAQTGWRRGRDLGAGAGLCRALPSRSQGHRAGGAPPPAG